MLGKTLLALAALHAASPADVATRPARSLTLAQSSVPENLDWNFTDYADSVRVVQNLMEGLFELDHAGRAHPALAESYTRSPDGLLYTFKLRGDVKWSDGRPLQAGDFVESWKRLLAPLPGSPYSGLLSMIDGAPQFHDGSQPDFEKVGISASGARELRVRLKRPCPFLEQLLALWVTFPVRADLIAKYGSAWSDPSHLVVLGPYTAASLQKGKTVDLRRNPSYHGPRPEIDEAHYIVDSDDASMSRQFLAGTLDLFMPADVFETARLLPKARRISFTFPRTQYLRFDLTIYPTNLKPVRQAIAMGLDKSRLAEALHRPVRAARSFVPPEIFPRGREIGYGFDLAGARRLLHDAGIDTAIGLKLTLVAPDTDDSARLSGFVQDQLKRNLGLKVDQVLVRQAAFEQRVATHADALVLGGWGADYFDPHTFLAAYQSTFGSDAGSWKNDEYNQLVDQALDVQPPADRAAKYEKALRIMEVDDIMLVPLYYAESEFVVGPRVKTFTPSALGEVRLREISLTP